MSKVSVSGILTVAPFAKVLSNKKRSDCLCGPGGAALICRRHEAASLLQCPGELNMVRRTDDVKYDDHDDHLDQRLGRMLSTELETSRWTTSTPGTLPAWRQVAFDRWIV